MREEGGASEVAPWWEDQAADWTQGQPGQILDLLTATFEQPIDIQLFARAIGLDWRAAPGGTTSTRDTWLWVLRRAAAAERISDLVAEVLNHPGSTAFHDPVYRVLGEGSFVVDARRVLRHGLAALPGNADSFGDRLRSAASEPSDTPVGSLEAITSPPSGLGDPKAYAQAIINATRRIAMIEVAGRPRGTGLLVGPDLLLTAAHVLDSRRWPPVAVDVVAVFDYFPMPGRSPAETGTRVGVSQFVCGSLPTEAEADGRVMDWDAPADRLDFAMLRLVNGVPDVPGDPVPRGHYRLGPESYAFDQAPLLFIVQHPLGEFQAFSYVRQSPQRNDRGTRIRYRSNTLLGSSGSPVIDTVGRLVAIHHYSATGTNQAVPVSEIAKTILASPYASLLVPGDDGSVPMAGAPRVVADEELQRCVVSISVEVGKKQTTGFFIAPRTILTAKRNLTEAIVGARYKVAQSRREFAAVVTAVPEELDLAVLEADESSQFWLPLDRSPAIKDRLIAFGFPDNHPDGDSLTAEVEGVINEGSARLLAFRSGHDTEGFSGAPLYNLDRRGVSGVVTSPRDTQKSRGGRAVAIASVLEVLPSVRALAWDLNSPGYQRDRAGLSTSEQIEALAREILVGDAVVVVGDVLDSSDRLSRRAVDEFIRQESLKALDNYSKRLELLNYLRSSPNTASKAYETLARLPFSAVVSLHPDAQLERALDSYRAVTLDESLRISELAVGKRDLYLFGGSVLFGKGLIIDQNDRDDLRERYNMLYRGFRDRLAMAPILFIGCSLAHWATKRLLYDILRHRTSLDGKPFAAASNSDWSAVVSGDTTVIDLPPAELVSALNEAVAGRSPIRMTTAWVDQIPKYKGFRYLDHYTESDRSVFFARSSDCDVLLGVVLSAPSKISVLCGRSGTGKTSLVLAGLQPLLYSKTHMRVEYLRSTADPLRMIEHSLVNVVGVESGYSLAADAFFAKLREHCTDVSSPILFVIDQFEEAFVKGGKQTTKDFLATIRALATLDWFPVRFLLVVREDFLYELADDRAGGPSTLASVYRLSDFDHDAASIVVKETAAAMGWECDQGFVGAMLEDLSPEHILPSHLQIVCHRVQEASAHLGKFSVSTYTRLGRASTILRNHVDDAMEGLSSANIRLIKTVLAAMVTSRDTKSLLTEGEITSRSGLPPANAKETLYDLIHVYRLVREIQLDDVRFELAHESLVPTVIEWLDASDHKLRTVQDIVDQEVVLGRRDPGHLIPDDRLSLIESVLSELNLSEDALSMVASSFCVRGLIPTAVADRLAVLPEKRQIESLLVRPVASDPHQLEAILRSPVSDALPESYLSDLPEPLRLRIADALRTGDDQVFRGLLKFLRVAPGLEAPILGRVASGGEAALRSLIDSARPDSLALLAQQAGRSLNSTISSLRLGLRLTLEYIDRWIESPNGAADCVDEFFRQAERGMQRPDALRVAAGFLADGLRPLNPAIFGATLCALASRGSRSRAADRMLTRWSARFVQDAIAKARPDQRIAICSGLINYALGCNSERWLSGLGSDVLSSLGNLSDGLPNPENPSAEYDILLEWIYREPTGAEPLARALGWSIRLPAYREGSEALMYRVQRGIEALRVRRVLSDALARQLVFECNAVFSLGESDLWHLTGPTEAELEELEAVLAAEKAALAEDRVMRSTWHKPDLSEWAGSVFKDIDDDVSHGTWWNHAWKDPDR